MGTTVSMSSPEPEACTLAEKAHQILTQKPLRMARMLHLSRLINDSTNDERLEFYKEGVLTTILDMISDCSSMLPRQESKETKQRRRRQSGNASNVKGVGYGFGSTRSRWDIERTVEERLVREEHLIWLLNAVTAYLYCASPDFSDPEIVLSKERHRLSLEGLTAVGNSSIIPLLEYHLQNESVFDVSEHMELYQALFEVACSMSLYPCLLDLLVRPLKDDGKSVVKVLVSQFRDVCHGYISSFKGQMGSPDFRLVDFIQKVERWAELLQAANAQAERNVDSGSVKGSLRSVDSDGQSATSSNTPTKPSADEPRLTGNEQQLLYSNALKHLHINTWKFIGDYGKLAVPYTFKKEARNLNPFSPALKERTKRIAKELASLRTALPLNLSNSIFVCVDEGRCDIMKVLITGPDGTPYQNGVFEFDVFFPSSYPFSPPKIAFLTTGSGNVRFNPNLYNDGKICLSILGTWEGRPEEKWNPYCSLLQVLVSIQGLIFVRDPYFNEPGFEKYMATDKGSEFSRKYNQQIEHATLQFAIRDQLRSGPEHFRRVIMRHFWLKRTHLIEQCRRWISEVRKDAALEASASAAKSNNLVAASADAVDATSNSQTRERVVELLIDELTNLSCPCDSC